MALLNIPLILKEKPMSIHPLAGKVVPKENLADIAELISSYYETQPDVTNPNQKVAFGTSGHRGTSLNFWCKRSSTSGGIRPST